ncbi:MAG: bifunctional phosphopantothenoylcysteine decarboxylase/phosphopantothenate--cysteine ligase CoaBC [Bacteroidetes bacterium]|nr:bifunctional phosphopantothenoylcysteine decarboxylase/phosphopantothenate--cysteine ligase CoaBC [Bacteroidota bacterium]
MLKGKKILIGITGSIAAYKIPLLIRLLKKAGAEVRVIMTPFAKEFVTPLTVSTLCGEPVYGDFFDRETGQWQSHVDLGLWADLMLIAPATANTMAKMQAGIADNYLLTVYLSARCPVMIAPAMDLDMYKHPATQENLQLLQKRGNLLIAPATGELASGLCGEGRMEEPEQIFQQIETFFRHENRFAGRQVLVSAGPTFEAIDPVRFIGNHSSGLMGVELALAFAREGAEVKLVLGPSAIKVNHPRVMVLPVTSADEMNEQCRLLFPQSDITVMAAAVADYKPAEVYNEKLKKSNDELVIRLVKTPDILSGLGKQKTSKQLLVGFALETEQEEANALDKLKRKNLDLIVLNSLKDEGAGFGHQTNKVSFFDRTGHQESFPLKQKSAVAGDILHRLHTMMTMDDVK